MVTLPEALETLLPTLVLVAEDDTAELTALLEREAREEAFDELRLTTEEVASEELDRLFAREEEELPEEAASEDEELAKEETLESEELLTPEAVLLELPQAPNVATFALIIACAALLGMLRVTVPKQMVTRPDALLEPPLRLEVLVELAAADEANEEEAREEELTTDEELAKAELSEELLNEEELRKGKLNEEKLLLRKELLEETPAEEETPVDEELTEDAVTEEELLELLQAPSVAFP
jgi:hypothetical protein